MLTLSNLLHLKPLIHLYLNDIDIIHIILTAHSSHPFVSSYFARAPIVYDDWDCKLKKHALSYRTWLLCKKYNLRILHIKSFGLNTCLLDSQLRELGEWLSPSDIAWPITLQELDLYACGDKDIYWLPPSLQRLSLGFDVLLMQPSLLMTMLPSSLRKLQLRMFNQFIPPGLLPNSLQELSFDDLSNFNQSLQVGSLPEGLLILHFGRDFDQPLFKGVLPSTLKHLKFGTKFTHPIMPRVLPNSLKELHFGYSFNQILHPGSLPALLEKLTFNSQLWTVYNKPFAANVLPAGLKTLLLNDAFNQDLSGALPANLTHLSLGAQFDKEVHELPSDLQILELGDAFEMRISDDDAPNALMRRIFTYSLPDSLRELTIRNHSSSVSSPIVRLPASMHTLEICSLYNFPLTIGLFPPTLRELTINTHNAIEPGVLNEGLEYLHLSCSTNDVVEVVGSAAERVEVPLLENALPSSLITLELDNGFNLPIYETVLPSGLQEFITRAKGNEIFCLNNGLKRLVFISNFNTPLTRPMPAALEYLELSWCFDQPLDAGILNHGLRNLIIRGNFNQPLLPGILPDTLVELQLSAYFNQPLSPGIFPASLESLTFIESFNQVIVPNVLPSNLKRLTLGRHFNQLLDVNVLPASLSHLELSENYHKPLNREALPDSLKMIRIGEKEFYCETEAACTYVNNRALRTFYCEYDVLVENTL